MSEWIAENLKCQFQYDLSLLDDWKSYFGQAAGWGAKIIDRMAKALKKVFPEMSGFRLEVSNI